MGKIDFIKLEEVRAINVNATINANGSIGRVYFHLKENNKNAVRYFDRSVICSALCLLNKKAITREQFNAHFVEMFNNKEFINIQPTKHEPTHAEERAALLRQQREFNPLPPEEEQELQKLINAGTI